VLGVKDDTAVGLIAFAFSVAGTLATKYLGDKATFSIARYSKATRIEMPKTSSEEYEELLVKQIGLFKRKHKKLAKNLGKNSSWILFPHFLLMILFPRLKVLSLNLLVR